MKNLKPAEAGRRILDDPENTFVSLADLVKITGVSDEEALSDLRSDRLKAYQARDGWIGIRGDDAAAWLASKADLLARLELHKARSNGQIRARATTRNREPPKSAYIPLEFWASMSREQALAEAELGYLDDAECRRLWKILNRSDRPPRRMWVQYAREDLHREFPLPPGSATVQ